MNEGKTECRTIVFVECESNVKIWIKTGDPHLEARRKQVFFEVDVPHTNKERMAGRMSRSSIKSADDDG